ncbi:M15 family metallopeptidase [Robbsia andropogonis]|uniref:M15 family metallopeptidase n=1 Tax=Robbsia andropogonis TaxID=28092 RepID=UPI002A6ADEF8|nr:M15 family metallopeptidase [Robbsia andropogonis]
MIFFALSGYFLAAVGIAILVFLPDARAQAVEHTARAFRRITGTFGTVASHGEKGLTHSARAAASTSARFRDMLVRRRLLLLISIGTLATPPLIALFLRGKQQIFQFSDTTDVSDAKIDALLHGEQLVPPPAPPPEVFTTREVEQIRPQIRNASRDWSLLDADFRTRLLLVYKLMAERYGYQMVLLEGYRSPDRQASLASSGNQVTQAGANRSYHQYGLAADNAFLRDGKVVISEKDPWAMRGYALYGKTAAEVGLVWGGDWSFHDYGHVEYHKPGFKMGVSKPLNPLE